MMTGQNFGYRRTQEGARALRSQRSVPAWYRSMLDLMPRETARSAICEGMSAHPRNQVLAWLDELETLGFVERVAPAVASSEERTSLPLPQEQAA
jgi:hypothetical protein